MVTQNHLGSPLTAFFCNPCFMKKIQARRPEMKGAKLSKTKLGGGLLLVTALSPSHIPPNTDL